MHGRIQRGRDVRAEHVDMRTGIPQILWELGEILKSFFASILFAPKALFEQIESHTGSEMSTKI